MNNKIYITGIGVITAIGNNIAENFKSLKEKKSGISKITQLDTVYKDEIPVGEVKLTDDDGTIRTATDTLSVRARTNVGRTYNAAWYGIVGDHTPGTPASGTNFNVRDIIEIGVNVTDDGIVANVSINITLPNPVPPEYKLKVLEVNVLSALP